MAVTIDWQLSSETMATLKTPLLPLLYLLLGGVHHVRGVCTNVTQFSTQLDALLAEYDREAPPAPFVLVSVALDVRHASVLESHGAVRLFADFTMHWRDERTKWNATEWGCESALAPAERLWLPDVVCLNATADTMSSGFSEGPRARLSSDGSVAWTTRLMVTVPLALRLTAWPDDTQLVVFAFGSREHGTDQILLELLQLKKVLVFEAGAWDMMSIKADLSYISDPVEADRSVVLWEVVLRRRAGGHLVAGGAVFAAGALLLLAAAGLPPAQRPPLAAAAAFITAFWLCATLGRLPGSARCPGRVAAVSALCVCAAASCVGAQLAQCTARRRRPAPLSLRSLLARASNVCRLTPTEWSVSESGAWAAAAVLLDRALAALLLLALLVLCILYILL